MMADDSPSFAFYGDVSKSNMDVGGRVEEITRRVPDFARWCAEHPEEQSDRMDRLFTVPYFDGSPSCGSLK